MKPVSHYWSFKMPQSLKRLEESQVLDEELLQLEKEFTSIFGKLSESTKKLQQDEAEIASISNSLDEQVTQIDSQQLLTKLIQNLENALKLVRQLKQADSSQNEKNSQPPIERLVSLASEISNQLARLN